MYGELAAYGELMVYGDADEPPADEYGDTADDDEEDV